MNKTDTTVVVVGAGPAGSVAARVVARAGVDVLLAGARAPGKLQVGESLVPSARTILEDLNLWDRFIAADHLACFGNTFAWGSSELADADFIHSPYGHGWHLDRARFDQMLCDVAQESGARIWDDAKLVCIERSGSRWRLECKTGQALRQVTCDWLIDCTGRRRSVAKRLGIAPRYEDRLLAFYARFRPAQHAKEDEDSRTLVESTPQGWVHTALLPSAERMVTFFCDAGTPWFKQARMPQGFLELVEGTTHVCAKLKAHDYQMSDGVHAADARSSKLECLHGEGWFAAGDAATCFDPLSSQGILCGLHSGLKAAESLARYLEGDVEAIEQYDSMISEVYERFLENLPTYYGYESRWPESPFWKARLSLAKRNHRSSSGMLPDRLRNA